MPFVDVMVEAGVVAQPDAMDAIWDACEESGFVAEKGADAAGNHRRLHQTKN